VLEGLPLAPWGEPTLPRYSSTICLSCIVPDPLPAIPASMGLESHQHGVSGVFSIDATLKSFINDRSLQM
jgi:hypothetical protein